ncbi:MAG TPA: hypothetical protein VGE52_18095, partial [Pirellulales bacterium]
MNRLILQTLETADGRYLTPEAWRPVESYLDALPRRLALADKLRVMEDAAVGATIDFMRGRYPTFSEHHVHAWEKGYRDVQLTLRYCVRAMVLNDVAGLTEGLLVWLRTMLAGNKMTPRFVRDTYESLRDHCFKQLSPDEQRLMEPAFSAAIEIL